MDLILIYILGVIVIPIIIGFGDGVGWWDSDSELTPTMTIFWPLVLPLFLFAVGLMYAVKWSRAMGIKWSDWRAKKRNEHLRNK